jgi:xyloglucan fucosyltransferase
VFHASSFCFPNCTGSRNPSSFKYAYGRAHVRLLGGLLSLDFDAATCLSRYEKSKHWKPSPFPVSPYLVQKLRQYEANHRRCGLGTANYREAMAQLMSGRNADHAECKYVVWFPIQGLGNRMLSVVSTFLYALLTGRVLLVHEPPEMEGLFCEPFPGTSWLLPPEFPYKDGFWWNSNDSYLTMIENGVLRYDDVRNASELPPYVYFHLEQIELRLTNHTFCEEDHRVLDRFHWMVIRSDSYFAVGLFLVPMYRDELDLMFPAKGSVFHHLGRYLLHPGNRVWDTIERFYDGYLAVADERLGIQVRIMPFIPLTFEIMYEQILRCTREHDLLPQVTSTSDPAVRPTNGTGAAKVKAVLVVSLKPEYYDKLHSLYYTKPTVTGEVVTVYQPSHDQDQDTEAREHNERALAEMFLLSYNDKLVTTGFSTFGYVAHSLAGLRPWLLSLLDRTTRRADVACVRPASVEPCLHSPPPLVCRAEQDPDPVAHLPFLRRCEDVDIGLKLFD